MPIFKIHMNFGISDRLKEYIRATYGANIRVTGDARNYTFFRVQAPSMASLDAAMLDIRSRLVEIEQVEA